MCRHRHRRPSTLQCQSQPKVIISCSPQSEAKWETGRRRRGRLLADHFLNLLDELSQRGKQTRDGLWGYARAGEEGIPLQRVKDRGFLAKLSKSLHLWLKADCFVEQHLQVVDAL